jgi:hypothetical protein
MMTNEARSRQLNEALQAMTTGAKPSKAMESATGMPLAELSTQLHRYVHSKLPYRRMTNPFPAQPAITITELPASADAAAGARRIGIEAEGRWQGTCCTSSARGPRTSPAIRWSSWAWRGPRSSTATARPPRRSCQRRLAARPEGTGSLRLMGESRLAAGEADAAHKSQYFLEARPFLARANAVNGSDFRCSTPTPDPAAWTPTIPAKTP